MSSEAESAGNHASTNHEDSRKSWFMYVLECRGGSLYTGIAVDVEKRFRAHQEGKGARYTRSFPPLRILSCTSYPDRAAASRAEYAFKQKSAQEKRLHCEAHPWPGSMPAPSHA